MPEQDTNIPEKISKAVQDLKKIRPGYESLLDFYEKIFVAQEQSRIATNVPDVDIPAETIRKKIAEGFPVANISDFRIDTNAATKLMREICGSSSSGEATGLSEAAGILSRAIDDASIDFGAVFGAFLGEDEDKFEKMAETLGIDKSCLGFFVYNSARPSLVMYAEKLASFLEKDNEWERGVCPVCGSPAAISLFDKEGKRSLCCSFCWHQWPSRRIFCNNCENTDHETLQYFSFENEEEHRADVCDKCKSYIKTVDIRSASRFIYPPLEYISTPHLDIKMREMGYAGSVNS